MGAGASSAVSPVPSDVKPEELAAFSKIKHEFKQLVDDNVPDQAIFERMKEVGGRRFVRDEATMSHWSCCSCAKKTLRVTIPPLGVCRVTRKTNESTFIPKAWYVLGRGPGRCALTQTLSTRMWRKELRLKKAMVPKQKNVWPC